MLNLSCYYSQQFSFLKLVGGGFHGSIYKSKVATSTYWHNYILKIRNNQGFTIYDFDRATSYAMLTKVDITEEYLQENYELVYTP